jgi:hypothetical protein
MTDNQNIDIVKKLIYEGDLIKLKTWMSSKRINCYDFDNSTNNPLLFSPIILSKPDILSFFLSNISGILTSLSSDSVLPTLVNPNEDTCLTLAVSMNDDESINRILAKSRSIISLPNKCGHTPLLIACQFGLTSVVDKLLKMGASISETDLNGNTPLHFAASYGQHKVGAQLISKSADPTLKNLKGWTPFDYCYSLQIYDYLRACHDAFLTSEAFPVFDTTQEPPKLGRRSSAVSVRRSGMVIQRINHRLLYWSEYSTVQNIRS